MKCDCGHTAKADGFTTGYGTDAQGKTHCFECCGKNDAAQLKADGRGVLYLTEKEGHFTLTNWPGTLKIQPYKVRQGRHNIARTRADVWFNFDGAAWHGVQLGDFNQICRVKRLKGAA